MCGICGIVGAEDAALVRRMQDVMSHRGPDERGTYSDKGVMLGHVRLSIIDLKTGKQPLTNEDKTVWVVFNGEIYNFQGLRESLEEKGHMFRTNTDTEVLVHLYEEYGAGMAERLRGMFAFAIWDCNERTLFLARDRLGKKPLYFAKVGADFVFASEIKAILEHKGCKRKVARKALNAYVTHQYVPSPYTMFEGVYKLAPGHRMTVREGKTKDEKYWDICLETDETKTERQFIAEMKRLLAESVEMRLVSDVPLGIYLSGGLDSSTVVALASQGGRRTVKTISVGFEWSGLDERPYSRLVAERFNTDHTEITVGDDAMKSFRDIAWHMDEPIADYAIVPTYLMSKHAKKHATVYLTGDGGDELYGGYSKYRWVRKREFLFGIPLTSRLLNAAAGNRWLGDVMDSMADSKDVRNVVRSAGDLDKTYIRGSRVLDEKMKKELLDKKVFNENPYDKTVRPLIDYAKKEGNDFLNKVLYLDVKTWLAEDFLMKVDKTTMAHSIEARSPLLDHLLVEHAYTIPSRYKVNLTGGEKLIFRKAVKDILPREITGRKKHGFEVPFDGWLKNELKASSDLKAFVKDTGFFRPEKAMRLLGHYGSTGKKDRGYEYGRRLWGLLFAFKTWHEIFIDRQ